jgi:inward rectifier potassium channel
MKRKPRQIKVRAGHFEFVKINAKKFDWRDAYHAVLTLSWPAFAAFVFCVYFVLNCIFAGLYLLAPNSVAEVPPGSFADAFFFSVETLATVGYGHYHPISFYGHVIATLEIMTGLFGLAVITGVIFVRFSRPTARIHFSKVAVISPFDGVPTLMIRVANLRHQAMIEAYFHMILVRSDFTVEGEDIRRFIPLKLTFDHLIAFPVALTLRHRIDETSPLYGLTAEDFQRWDVRILVSIVAVDTVIPAPIQSASDYNHDQIQWGWRFVEIYRENKEHQWTVDYGKIDETEEAVPLQSPAKQRSEPVEAGSDRGTSAARSIGGVPLRRDRSEKES